MQKKKSLEDNIEWVRKPWTQQEVDTLHEIARNYSTFKLLKDIIKWIVIWILGLPAVTITALETIGRLLKLLKSMNIGG